MELARVGRRVFDVAELAEGEKVTRVVEVREDAGLGGDGSCRRGV